MNEAPDLPTLVKLECVAMPNGEIICHGKVIGKLSELGDYIEEVTDDH